MDKKRDYGIESLRWISMLAVVMHHGISHQRFSPRTIDQIMAFKDWIEWCVPAFFYISGRLFRSSAASDLARSLPSRARRLLTPYLLVSFASFAALWTLHHTGIWRHSRPEELLFGDLLHKLVWLVGFGPQLYFLPYLFLVGLLAGIAALAIPRCWLSTAAFALFVLCGFGWVMPDTVLGPGLERLPAFLLSFCLGVTDRSCSPGFARIHLAAVLAATAAIGLLLHDAWPLSIAVPLLLYRVFDRLPTASAIRFLDRAGTPGSIFLWHAPLVLPACSTLLGALGVANWGNYLLAVVLACIASFGISRIVARIPLLRHAKL